MGLGGSAGERVIRPLMASWEAAELLAAMLLLALSLVRRPRRRQQQQRTATATMMITYGNDNVDS